MSWQGYEELSLLNRKLDELLKKYHDLREENRALRTENEKLVILLRQDDEKIKELESKYEIVKLSGALLGEEKNAAEAKKKINELVREIDRCVALINR